MIRVIRRSLLMGATAALIGLGSLSAQAAGEIKAIASFSILADMVARIGGERVAVTALVGPDGDAHVFQPTPSDARNVATANVVFVNGLGFEGWLDRLITAAGYKGPVITATEGIATLAMEEEEEKEEGHDHDHDHDHADGDHDKAEGEEPHHHGGVDPHAWQSIANARIYAANIASGLAKVDPKNAATYAANRDRYLADLDVVEKEILSMVKDLPQDRRKIVTTHDAFGYFGDAYGLSFLAPQGMSTDAEPSAGDVAALIRQIRAEDIRAVFVENITDRRLLDQIARETGAKVGGTLYSDSLSAPTGPAGTYLDMMRHNIRAIAGALRS